MVGIALSGCLSGQLHGHLIHSFILLFPQCNVHCRIGISHLRFCLICQIVFDICSVSSLYVCVCVHLIIGSVSLLNLIVR